MLIKLFMSVLRQLNMNSGKSRSGASQTVRIRPTGLLDTDRSHDPIEGQIDDLLAEIPGSSRKSDEF
jgi:excinuclease UvrABC helicase subunit UvrB